MVQRAGGTQDGDMTFHESNSTVHPNPNHTTQLTRSRDDAWIAGVCGGVAAYTGWDPSLVRALTVVGALVSFGTVALLYLSMVMLVPRA
jgi:phage shock protein C